MSERRRADKSGVCVPASVAVLLDLLLKAPDFLVAGCVVKEFAFAGCIHARDALPGLEPGQLAPCLGAEALTLDLLGFVRRGLGCGIGLRSTTFAKCGLGINACIGRLRCCVTSANGVS